MTEAELKENMKNRLWRLNNLYYIINESGERVLFRCNYVQSMLYKSLWWLNIILKSRQHGITTFVCIMMLDLILFNSNVKAGIIAHTMQAAQEIFRDKIKYTYSQLPEAIKAAVPFTKCDACQLVLQNNSSVIIACSLRSGTYQWVHISEYGKICAKTPDRATEIQSGTLETVHKGGFVTIESTAEGRAGDFYDRCKRAEDLKIRNTVLGEMDYRFHFFAWYLDPKNTTHPNMVRIPDNLVEYFNKLESGLGITLDAGQRAWYTQKKLSLKTLIYREHPSTPEEAFKASIEGSYYGTEMSIARETGRICRVPHDKSAEVYTFWDIGHRHTAVWFAQFIKKEIRLIDYYQDNEGLGMAAYALMIQRKPYRYGKHFAPWDMQGSNARSIQTGRDLIDVAKDSGLDFDVLAKDTVDSGIKVAIDVLNQCWFDLDLCDEGIKCLEMYRAEWNETLEDYERKPLADKYAHGADAFRYLAMAYRYERIGDVILGYSGVNPTWRHQPTADRGIEDLLSV